MGINLMKRIMHEDSFEYLNFVSDMRNCNTCQELLNVCYKHMWIFCIKCRVLRHVQDESEYHLDFCNCSSSIEEK